ncbi:MAG: hypothetical protein JWQ38_5, partial [Flavipsychrobacter sp.]|nr:hypothetical protein [Flavipsychrobacter sp.]
MNIEKEIDFDQNDLRALLNNTNDLIWSVDRNYKLLASNKAFDEILLQMTGIPVVKGRDILAHGISEEQSSTYKVYYDRAFSGEAFKVKEYTDIPIVFWSELSIYPIYNHNGEITGTACYSHDITAQTIAEEKIERSGASLKAIFENSSESFFLTDIHGTIIALNSNARKTMLLTCPTRMETGTDVLIYISEERKAPFSAILSKVAAGASIKYEQSFLGFDGIFYSYEFYINPVKESDIVTGLCFNGRDITEQTLARERLEQNEKRLEAEQGKFTNLFLKAPSCICILKGPDHVFEMANPNYMQLTGKKNIVGKSLAELFPEVESQGFLAMMDNI